LKEVAEAAARSLDSVVGETVKVEGEMGLVAEVIRALHDNN
jgi:hypothetical protein